MPKQLYAKAIEKMCALNYSNENYFNKQGFLLMKKFLSLLSIFAIIAMLFTSCEGGGGGEGEEGEITAEGCYLFPDNKTGFYLDGGTKYDFFTKDQKTIYYDKERTGKYTVAEKKVTIDGTIACTLGYNKLTQTAGNVTLTKITPTTKTGLTAAEYDAQK